MKTKQILLLFIAVFATLTTFSQDIETDIETDTIQLKETVVGKKHRPKRISYKFRRGFCTHHEYLSWIKEIAAMAYDLPGGKLKMLRFNFNNPFRVEEHIYYKDTQLELNIYDIGPDGYPGNKIASKAFTVPGSHQGSMDIDVSDLEVQNENGIYIALHRLTGNAESGKNEFEVDCTCAENEKYKMVARDPRDGSWRLMKDKYGPFAFLLTVKMER